MAGFPDRGRKTNEGDMEISAETSVEASVEKSETSVKTSDALLKLLQQNPEMTLAEVADPVT